ncbi:MAG TPA: 23S rRNA (guanosine(2251)-2'-O)-methyltransferase RlmB, partial [Cytophagaceae bacterium]|nr:23S rRNA (guanosine(2251)-2'-O)-methyltransferase RlmB [Cytophagaceae bacterium]
MENNNDFVFGIRPVIEAIKSGKEIERILIQKEIGGNVVTELLQLASKHNIPIVKVPVDKLNRITRKVHQGVICFISSVIYASLDNIISEVYRKGDTPFILVLDRVTDVRNFGAIARSAECLGVQAIVIPSRGSAQINSDAVKTSAGALNYIPVCREDNLKTTLKYLKENGLKIIACSEKGGKTIDSADCKGPVALVMGSEEDGISSEYLKLSDEMLKIPIIGKIQSLNVSVAAGIMMYEVVR